MVDKVLQLVGGKQTEVPGTVTSTGSAEAGKMVALGPDGRLDPTLMPTGLVLYENVVGASIVLLFLFC